MVDLIIAAGIVIVVLLYAISKKNEKIRELEEKNITLSDKIRSLEKSTQASEAMKMDFNENVQTTENVVQNVYQLESIKEEKSERFAQQKEIPYENIAWQDEEKEDNVKKEKQKRIERNNVIFTIGATFIIVAAISFLCSTWHIIPDVIKTSIILIFAFIFLGLGKIAENVFKLPKTAKAFFYMAMVYIPICLFSISAFGLVGKYFSINGEGKYIYLSFASFIIMATYLFYAYKNKDKKLYVSGKVMQLLMVVFLSLIVTTNILNIVLVIIIYSVILNIVNCKKNSIFKKEASTFKNIIIYAMTGVAVMLTLFMSDEWLYKISYLFLIIFDYALDYLRGKKSYSYIIAYVLTYLLLFSTMNLFAFSGFLQQIVTIIFLSLTGYYHNFLLENEEIKSITNWVDALLCIILALITDAMPAFHIERYGVCIITSIILFIEYLKNRENGSGLFGTALCINAILMLIPQNISTGMAMSQYICVNIFSLAFMVLLHKDKNEYLKIIPIVSFIINLYTKEIILFESINLNCILGILGVLVFGFLAIRNKKDYIYRTASFILLLSLFQYIDYDIVIYLGSILVTIWAVIQMLFARKEIRVVMKWLIVVSLIYMYFAMIAMSRVTVTVYSLGILHSLICMFIFSRSKNLKLIPMIGIIIPLYSYNLILLGKYDITLVINLAMITIFAYLSLIGKKDFRYMIVSFIYLLGFICKYTYINEYVRFAMVFIWAIVQYFNTKDITKDIMLALAGLSGLIIYMIAIYDLYLQEITLIKMLGFILYAYIILHKIIEKYSKDACNWLEYFVFAIIYMVAFGMYADAIDLAMFMFMQVGIIILAYMKRYGPVFIVTACGTLLNLIYLTRKFWLSIPWWGYLVVVGGILLFFAARNEFKEKKDVTPIKENIEKFKNYFNM